MRSIVIILIGGLLIAPATVRAGAEHAAQVRLNVAAGSAEHIAQRKAACGDFSAFDLVFDDGINSPVIQEFCASGVPRAELFSDKDGRQYVLRQESRDGPTGARDDRLIILRPTRDGFLQIANVKLPTSPATAGDDVRKLWRTESEARLGVELTIHVAGSDGHPTDRTRRIWIVPTAGSFGAPQQKFSAPAANIDAEVVPLFNRSNAPPLGQGWCGPPSEDAITLRVILADHAAIDEKLCTAYGDAKARTFTDKGGRNYVALDAAIRGTGPLRELRLFQVNDGRLEDLLTVPLSWPTGGGAEYNATVNPETDATRGLKLTVRGRFYVPDNSGQTWHLDSRRADTVDTIWLNPSR